MNSVLPRDFEIWMHAQFYYVFRYWQQFILQPQNGTLNCGSMNIFFGKVRDEKHIGL